MGRPRKAKEAPPQEGEAKTGLTEAQHREILRPYTAWIFGDYMTKDPDVVNKVLDKYFRQQPFKG
jgi:hypothetical protein